jgi:hypothetical protein
VSKILIVNQLYISSNSHNQHQLILWKFVIFVFLFKYTVYFSLWSSNWFSKNSVYKCTLQRTKIVHKINLNLYHRLSIYSRLQQDACDVDFSLYFFYIFISWQYVFFNISLIEYILHRAIKALRTTNFGLCLCLLITNWHASFLKIYFALEIKFTAYFF